MMLRLTAVVVSLLLPLAAFTQNNPYGQPGQAGMQNMMQQMQQMGKCMAEIDQSRLEALSEEAQKFSEEIQSLCKAGNEAAAKSSAIAFARKMRNEPVIQKVQECTKGMRQMMGEIMPVNPVEVEEKAERGSICD